MKPFIKKLPFELLRHCASSLIQNEDVPNVLYIADKRYHLFHILSKISINISAFVEKLTSSIEWSGFDILAKETQCVIYRGTLYCYITHLNKSHGIDP